MTARKVIAGVAGVAVLAVAGSGVATAAKAPKAPSKVTVKEAAGIKMKPNRYLQDQLRWNKDVYTIKSGGTLTVIGNVVNEGPHSLSIVRPKDLPKNGKQVNNCKVCNTLGAAHQVDQNTGEAKFLYLENGKGQDTPPDLNKVGDSAIFAVKKGDKVKMKVTAKPGKTLSFVCGFHPWMQAKIKVVK
jgi:hypothetical protein